jgi:hypothetical protein
MTSHLVLAVLHAAHVTAVCDHWAVRCNGL